MPLQDLERKYLTMSIPIYRGNTEVVPLIDGDEYFSAIYGSILGTGTNDVVFIVNWQFDPDFELLGPASGTRIVDLLASKVARGVDVRLVLNGALVLHGVPQLPFKLNLDAAEKLRALPNFDGRVLFDWSGANLSGSHHQKATVVKAGTHLVAFVGGMDFNKDHWDKAPHVSKKWPDGSAWGWHDIGVQLRGEAAKGVWENFRERWDEASTLPNHTYYRGTSLSSKPLNPYPLPSPGQAPTPTPSVASSQSVQILRSRYRWKIPNNLFPSLGKRWDYLPQGYDGIYEVYMTLTKAILAAEKYIYIEDQFLQDQPHLEVIPDEASLFRHIADRIKINHNLKVIFVGSGKSDPIDPLPGLRNRTLTRNINDIIQQLQSSSLPMDLSRNVAVWRIKDVTVHSKLTLIDDKFAAIGSANFQSRSMYGVDSELHVAFVADDDLVQKLRVKLWAEHLRLITPLPTAVDNALKDPNTALGIWRRDWLPSWAADYWTPNTPMGFQPTAQVLELVGP